MALVDFLGAETIRISPFFTRSFTSPSSLLSSSRSFGIRIPRELPIGMIEVNICSYIVITNQWFVKRNEHEYYLIGR